MRAIISRLTSIAAMSELLHLLLAVMTWDANTPPPTLLLLALKLRAAALDTARCLLLRVAGVGAQVVAQCLASVGRIAAAEAFAVLRLHAGRGGGEECQCQQQRRYSEEYAVLGLTRGYIDSSLRLLL
jgi:hypothetical protein